MQKEPGSLTPVIPNALFGRNGATLPAGWVNSTVIFAAVPVAEITKNYATLVAFSYTSYYQAPNEAVWAINYARGRNPLIRWNGEYIGTQSN